MSLQINTLNTTFAFIEKTPRTFTVSPNIYGKSVWDIDVQPLNVSSSAVYTLIPNYTFDARIKMWGAGGGNETSFHPKGDGGGGGYSEGIVRFLRGQHYIMVVGQGGYAQPSSTVFVRTIGGGGSSKVPVGNTVGGGLSGLFVESYTQSNAVIIAGGGGGGSTYGINDTPYVGGAGGGTSGQNGQGSSYAFGYGGTQTYGGAGAAGSNPSDTVADSGSALLGGHGASGHLGSPCGGGGGYFGGGASGCGNGTAFYGGDGAAGGGSGYIKAGTVRSGTTLTGTGAIPANSADADRMGAGNGGTTASFSSGSNGRVIIS